MGENKTERQKFIDKGNYGMYYKPLAQQIGLEAAVILDFLIYKHDHFVVKKGIFKLFKGVKSFYITYNDIEKETSVKAYKLGRKVESNPIVILENLGLITKTTIQMSHIKTTYYTLHFDKINKAFDKAIKYQKDKRKKVRNDKDKKISLLLEDKISTIDVFLKKNLNVPKTGLEPSDSLVLQIDSMDTVNSTSPILPNIHITKNKITKNKKIKKKLTSEKRLDEDSEFQDKELENMFGYGNNRDATLNSKIYDNEVKSNNELYDLIKETRRGIITPQVFFNTIVNEILKDKFKGFSMSKDDKLLINEALINNPLFEFENEDIIARDNAISVLMKENNNFTEEEILEEIEFDEDKYEMLYNMVWEKIMKNCERINVGKLKARFGNIFSGIREISNNYRPFMDQ